MKCIFNLYNITFLLVCLFFHDINFAQTHAFPGAVGYGKYASGGRGGDVYHVTNLDDSGPGSLRYGIDNKDDAVPRTIVFDIGGNIQLHKTLYLESDLTIVGQTAPGGGITIWGYPVRLNYATDVIIRGLRFRVGDFNASGTNGKPDRGNADLKGDQADPFEIGWSDRVVIDHVSAAWGIDETLSIWEAKNITIQHSLIAESLNDSYHDKGKHGYGSVVKSNAEQADRDNGTGGITYFGNLFAKHYRRNPCYGGGVNDIQDFEFVNNVIYNWGKDAGHNNGGGSSDYTGSYINFIGNYYIAGPETPGPTDERPWENRNSLIFREWGGDNTRFYHGNTNLLDKDYDAIHNGQFYGDDSFGEFNLPFESSPFDFPVHLSGETLAADEAYEMVIESAGASTSRDYHDQRIIDEVLNRTGQILDSQDELIELYNIPDPIIPLDTGVSLLDTDQDGMPDDWEVIHSLNPEDPEDRNGDLDGDGYTNLEEYLNSIYDIEVTGIAENDNVPDGFRLEQNYPNPFSARGGSAYGGNLSTTIKYRIPLDSKQYTVNSSLNPESSIQYQASSIQPVPAKLNGAGHQVSITLKVYDILGREVATLFNGRKMPGNYELIWDAAGLPAGVYFYQLQAGKYAQTRKMVLLK